MSDMPESLPEKDLEALLIWALEHWCEHEPFDTLGELSHEIYSHAWRQISSENNRSPQLIDCLAKGFLKAAKQYHSPFSRDYDRSTSSRFVMSKDEFVAGQSSRMQVMDSLVKFSDFNEQVCNSFASRGYPLVTASDLIELLQKFEDYDDMEVKKRYAECIKAVVSDATEVEQEFVLDRLHEALPELYDSYDTMVSKRAELRGNGIAMKLNGSKKRRSEKLRQPKN